MTISAAQRPTWLDRALGDVVPPHIADDLRQAQIDSLIAQVPVLLAVGALNTLILMAVSAWNGLPFVNYGWMGGLVVYALVRSHFVRRQLASVSVPDDQRRLVRGSTVGAIALLTLLGVTAAVTYVTGVFNHSLLIPMSLGFGSISIAHCLYRLRRVALASIILGIGPSALALVVAGDFEAKMLGVSMVTVGLLMMRFVSAQYRQQIDNLMLHHHVRQMANSDPLTGLANRRAVDGFLRDQAANDGLAIALFDLDGFKQVNDSHGHAVGDALLKVVGERLDHAFGGPGLVGRLGGDEFIIILTDAVDAADLDAEISGIFGALCRPARIDALHLSLDASVGYARRRDQAEDAAALLKRADEALYDAKRQRDRSVAEQRPVRAA